MATRSLKPYFCSRGSSALSMLISLVIIVALAALLLPTLQTISRKARLVQCANSMRQLHVGAMLYVSDNNGWIPPAYSNASEIRWFDLVAGPLNLSKSNRLDPKEWKTRRGSTFHCPDETVNTGVSYSYNRSISMGRQGYRRMYRLIPPEVVFIMEQRQKPELVDFSPYYGLTNPDGSYRFGQRHDECANVLFFGGNVVPVKTSSDIEIRKLRWTWPGWQD